MLITAPTTIPKLHELDIAPIFIAGGISGCADWQSEIVKDIDTTGYDVFNPRRPGGLSKEGAEAEEQIAWEFKALRLSWHAVFWFPSSSICPITLFEYGKLLGRLEDGDLGSLVVGWDHDYQRAFDLEVQTKLVAEAIGRANNDRLLTAVGFDSFREKVRKAFGP